MRASSRVRWLTFQRPLIREVEDALALYQPLHRDVRAERAAHECRELFRVAKRRQGVEMLAAVIGRQGAHLCAAKAVRLFQYCVEHRGEIAGRGIDDLEDFGRRRLLLARLAQFGGQPRDRLVRCLGGCARR